MGFGSRAGFVCGVLALGLTVGTGGACAQDFPTRPIRIITSGVGGSSDIAARTIAQGIAPALGQPVVVDNRPAGLALVEMVARSAPDGLTLLFYGSTTWLGPFMQKASYDPVKDLAPVTLALTSPNILVVHPSLPARTVKELIAIARAHPGELNYGTSGSGGSSHLAGELFKAMSKTNIVRINYKSGGMALNDLLSGALQLSFPAAATVSSQVNSGRLRALAVTGLRPSVLFPALPSIASAGVPGYESVAMFGMFAPAKTPDKVLARLNQETVRFLNAGEAKSRFAGFGMEVVGSTPSELAATMAAEMSRMGKVIRDANIRAE